jgi:hypothetical protein
MRIAQTNQIKMERALRNTKTIKTSLVYLAVPFPPFYGPSVLVLFHC